MKEKIVLQNFTAAFLKADNNYLLMKRAPNRKIAPNIWSGVGGKIEANEINDPLTACLREINEETGITKEHIFNLNLRYIIIRRIENTIRQSYIYFGDTDVDIKTELTQTEEGTLHWISENNLLERQFSQTFDAMLKHYINSKGQEYKIIVGVSENLVGKLNMNWSVVEDFD